MLYLRPLKRQQYVINDKMVYAPHLRLDVFALDEAFIALEMKDGAKG